MQRIRRLAESIARDASSLALHPWANLWTYLEYRFFRVLLKHPAWLSGKRRQKFERQRRKREPGRFLEAADAAMVALETPLSAVTGGAEPALDFRSHDPDLSAIAPDVRLIAFYLPQFHPFAENDAWWGKGFTEWTNVGKALPLFEGHYQPHCPVHFGYYDLRVPEVMEEQARIARHYGIAGFAHHFYWFDGKTLMERPLRDMLSNPAVDIPFCLSWANENWTRRWDGREDDILIAQKHSPDDSRAMIRHVAEYFRDPRYIRIGGRPVFLVYRPRIIPDLSATVAMWREEARALGLGDIYLIGAQTDWAENHTETGFDASVEFPPHGSRQVDLAPLILAAETEFSGRIVEYSMVVKDALAQPEPTFKVYRGVTLGWDNTARRKISPMIMINFSIASYRRWLGTLIARLRADPALPADEKIVFINAWNEWAEGTHLEPDQRYGFAYLAATREALTGPADELAP